MYSISSVAFSKEDEQGRIDVLAVSDMIQELVMKIALSLTIVQIPVFFCETFQGLDQKGIFWTNGSCKWHLSLGIAVDELA